MDFTSVNPTKRIGTDYKRLCGPQTTFDPELFKDIVLPREKATSKSLIGTSADHSYMKTNFINQANGSAYIEFGRTKVIACVYGPKEVSKREEFCPIGQLFFEIQYAPFYTKTRRNPMLSKDKDLSLYLQESIESAVCLHRYPKAAFLVMVTIVEDGGRVLPAAIMSSSLALADAGVEMYDLVSSCVMNVINNQISLDPKFCLEDDVEPMDQDNEDSKVTGLVIVSKMASINQVTSIVSFGSIKSSFLSQAVSMCAETCYLLHTAQRKCLTENIMEVSQT